MVAVTFGRNAFDGINNVKTVNDFTEYGIAPVLDNGFAVQLFRTEV